METSARFATSTIVAMRSATNPLSSERAISMTRTVSRIGPAYKTFTISCPVLIETTERTLLLRERTENLKGISPYLNPVSCGLKGI
jgi:hypothetical protein